MACCWSTRAGHHQVEIEVVRGVLHGRLTYDFNADSFGPNCDPNQKPAFNVHRPRMQQTARAK